MLNAQTDTIKSETLIIKGIAADHNGLLEGKNIMLLQVNPEDGKPRLLYNSAYGTFAKSVTTSPTGKILEVCYKLSENPRAGKNLNPSVQISPKGQFLIKVQKALLDSFFKPNELSLVVEEARKIHHEPYIFKYDRNIETIDVGKIVFEPLK
jgi:hypothetical protein